MRHAGGFWTLLVFQLLTVPVTVRAAQSIIELAQKEAERRKVLEDQGIEGKVVELNGKSVAPDGNVTVSAPAYPRKAKLETDATKGRASSQSLRKSLERLDREIRLNQERLDGLRSRLAAERWTTRTGRSSAGASQSAVEKLSAQIRDLEAKLKGLQKQRSDTYESGRKLGYLPGELDGKGIVP